METEFYKSIPPEIREKLQEYYKLYAVSPELPFHQCNTFGSSFNFSYTKEGFDFWISHDIYDTFPIWSDELNRFIDLPTPIDINENPNKFYPL